MNMQKISDGFRMAAKPLLGVAGLALMIVWSGGACRDKVKPGTVGHEPGVAVPAGADVAVVVVEPVAPRMDVVGTVTSEEKIHLSARLSAYVNAVAVSAGTEVKKGEVLLTLDDRDIREQLAGAEAQLKQAEAEFNRAKQLLETKATTEQAFVAAETGFNAAKAQMERVKVMLSYAAIVSPIDGIVTDRRIEAGDLANPGQVLFTVYDPKRMRLEAAVPVRLADRLAVGQELEVTLDRPARTYKARMAQIVSEVDAASRTRTVKVTLDGDMKDVLPGTFGRLYLEEPARPTILIPAGAVYRVGQLEMVQVVEGARAIRRTVRTGAVHGNRVEVISGLRAGERVLASPVKEG